MPVTLTISTSPVTCCAHLHDSLTLVALAGEDEDFKEDFEVDYEDPEDEYGAEEECEEELSDAELQVGQPPP